MESSTLQKKKNTISKGKVKKTIKNVLCRPDPVFWPAITEEQGKALEETLSKYKAHIPAFNKPHWKELKLIPKEKRPKPPKIERVNGFLFGIATCSTAILNGDCSGVVIESSVNPRTIVQPILEACSDRGVPVVCVTGLRNITTKNFGIPTTCLGVKKDCLQDICDKINELTQDKLLKDQLKAKLKTNDVEMNMVTIKTNMNMDIKPTLPCPYLYRTNKKVRIFVPPSECNITKSTKSFIGQDFIEFSDKPDNPMKTNRKALAKMMVKRISNNPKRVKVK